MNKLFEQIKIDCGLVPQTINNSNVTGKYFDLSNYRSVIAVLMVGAMAATKTAKVEFLQAKDSAGTDSKTVDNANATITANTNATELTIALATVTAGQTITINGLTFTAAASLTTYANREFGISGTDTEDGDQLAACINHPTYGVPGVTATNNSGTLTLVATDPGEKLITASSAAGTVTIATTKALAYVELETLSAIDAEFNHLAAKVTSTANGICGVCLIRGGSRNAIEQQVGASASV